MSLMAEEAAPRICLITAGHLSTCPRMVKVADTLWEAGYRVRVVSARYSPWASEGDDSVLATRKWPSQVYDYSLQTARLNYYGTALRQRAAKVVCRTGLRKCLHWRAAALSRAHSNLVDLASSEDADLFYAGTSGALAVGYEAARRRDTRFALDLEDFHTGEADHLPRTPRDTPMIQLIEQVALPQAQFLTAASEPIARAYRSLYRVDAHVINNVFPLPPVPPSFDGEGEHPLKLYWFSQTVGPDRGLEDAIMAMSIANVPAELHLRGVSRLGYLQNLIALAAERAPLLELKIHAPGAPDSMVSLARGYDIGLALEQPTVLNRDLCLTNKAFVYLLAGLAVIFTDTVGQRQLARSLGDAAFIYRPGDVDALAQQLVRWHADREYLRTAKRSAWHAASTRWHWEHHSERGALLRLVESALAGNRIGART